MSREEVLKSEDKIPDPKHANEISIVYEEFLAGEKFSLIYSVGEKFGLAAAQYMLIKTAKSEEEPIILFHKLLTMLTKKYGISQKRTIPIQAGKQKTIADRTWENRNTSISLSMNLKNDTMLVQVFFVNKEFKAGLR